MLQTGMLDINQEKIIVNIVDPEETGHHYMPCHLKMQFWKIVACLTFT